MQPNAQPSADVIGKAQIRKCLTGIVKGFATGDDAKAIIGTLDHVAIQSIGADIGKRRVPLGLHEPRFLIQWRVGPADVHARLWHGKALRQDNLNTVVIHPDRRRRFHDFLNGFHATPQARKAAHGKGMQTHVQNTLHIRWEEHGKSTGLENVIALMGCG